MELLSFITKPFNNSIIKFGEWIESNTIFGIKVVTIISAISFYLIIYSSFKLVYWLGQQSVL
jgi:hypothetical protein